MPLLPILATALGAFGPDIVKWIAGDKAGAAAQIVTDKAKEIFGTDDPSGVEAALKRDPNLALQYSMAVLAAKTESERIAADREKAERQAEADKLSAILADIQSARNMGVAYANVKSALAWGAPIVSVLAILLSGAVAYMLLWPNATAVKWAETIVTMLAGAAIGWVNTVLNYWLGSSMGSQNKDAMMADLKGLLVKGGRG